MEISIPNSHMGDVTGDLTGRRGRVLGADVLGDDQAIVRAAVPLSEVTNYASQLKSMTAGQGGFTMELSGYEPAPAHVQQRVAAEFQPAVEED
jgi:elongation factor G